jgi:hypothetical protein
MDWGSGLAEPLASEKVMEWVVSLAWEWDERSLVKGRD